MEDLNSEISGFSCSIPSEPPDIRNWFSSYKYESFVLDTCENFGGFFSEERESDKYDLGVGKINREKEENFDGSAAEIREADEHDNFNSKEDSLHSLSVLSEPPDIRKWCSSYVYESPLLDTNDGFKRDIYSKNECGEDELVNEECINDSADSDKFQQNTSDKICSIKVIKCSSSLVERKNESHPLFSEPLDIGNWFPDYVYESPVLDTNDEFEDSLSKNTEPSRDKFVVEDSKRQKRDNFKTTTKTGCRDEVVVGKKMFSNGFEECNSPIRHDEQENKSTSKDFGEVKPTHGSNDKENGFITTKKTKFIRANDENCLREAREIVLQGSGKTTGSEKDYGVAKRKVLAETTNVKVEQQCEAKAMEIMGKWRCPRKSKPPRGPPLKQLRLERWINRV
ncbi:hypothetical protein CXB51_020049 [Gossypium anomalum]|uniref:Uncharacterized protein n=1 Tax=Gossypium anomalum TaxID=47600 RepID=A0A8J6CY98_9ROSI|nr:hypothetical protein CXB51_020049 [Gossypium anomalum]